MAPRAGLPQAGLHETVRAVIAMGVVAGTACHFPLANRMVGTLIELCPLRQVALVADLGLLLAIQYRIVCNVDPVATGTGHVAELVQAAFPVDALVVRGQ